MAKQEITDMLAENENMVTLSMEQVRDAWDYGRLGVHVRRQVSNDLRGMGIGHYPRKLPEYQHEPVRLYKLGTPVADLIDAVLHPSEDNDAALRQVIAEDAQQILNQVKAIVCE